MFIRRLIFLSFLFLCVGFVNGQNKKFDWDKAVVICEYIAGPPPPLRISEIPEDSVKYYEKIMICHDSLEKTDNSRSFEKRVLLCGGFFVNAVLENQSCPSTSKNKQQLCISRYKSYGAMVPDYDTLSDINIEIKERQVPSNYLGQWGLIYFSATRDKFRLIRRTIYSD